MAIFCFVVAVFLFPLKAEHFSRAGLPAVTSSSPKRETEGAVLFAPWGTSPTPYLVVTSPLINPFPVQLAIP